MDYFDQNNEVVDLEKKLFEQKYSQQMRMTKRVFLWLGIGFMIIGTIFLVFMIIAMPEIAFAAIPFALFGVVFLILGIVISEKGNYNNYKKRIAKGGYLNIYEMNARMAILEKKNEILESKIKKLEDEIRKLK